MFSCLVPNLSLIFSQVLLSSEISFFRELVTKISSCSGVLKVSHLRTPLLPQVKPLRQATQSDLLGLHSHLRQPRHVHRNTPGYSSSIRPIVVISFTFASSYIIKRGSTRFLPLAMLTRLYSSGTSHVCWVITIL